LALNEPENKHLKNLRPYIPSESEEEDEFLDPLYHESTAKGVILEVGDVIRLGRVCYIVKESSIELGE